MSTRGEQSPTAERDDTELATIIYEYILSGDPVPVDQAPPGHVGMLSQIAQFLHSADTPQPIVENARQRWQESPDLPKGNDVEATIQKAQQLGRWHEITQILSDLRLDRDQFAYNPALDANEY